MRTHLAALGFASLLAIGGTFAASAGPLPIGNSAIKAATADTTEIRWRGRSWGPAVGFGLAAGALAGAAIATSPYGYYGYGYDPGYYYEAPVAAVPYGYAAPGYYGGYGYSGYGYGRCYTDEGYGRRRSCSGQ